MGSRYRTLRALALVGLVGLAVPGCGSSAGAGGGGGGGGRAELIGVESGLPGDPTPVRGGNLVYGIEGETDGGYCLPEATLAMSGLQVVRGVYDHLAVPDGKGGYVPYLAKSITHDPSFKVWTVTLRPGITFHDGLKLDADAVKANLDAYRGVPGKHKRQSVLFQFTLRTIASVEVVDELTVRITTSIPRPAFPGELYSSGRLAIMSPTQLNASPEDCRSHPIGTGPFVFVSWEKGRSLLVQRNTRYWLKAPDGQPYPYLDTVEFRPIPNGDFRIASLRKGDITIMHTSAAADMVGSLAQLRDDGEINLLISNTQTEVTYGIINSSRPGFDDLEVRRAAAMAIDRDKLNEVGNAGFPEVADGPYGPGVLGYLQDNGFPEYDLAAAKAAVARLKAAGKRTSFTFLTPDNPSNLRLAVTAKNMLAAAGFDMKLEVVTEPQLIDRVIAGEFDVAAFRNHPGEDPDLNYVWFYGKGNPVNFGRFDDPVINENLDRGRTSQDPKVRKAAYEAVNRQFGKEVWNIWLYSAPWAIAEATTVHGILGPPLSDKVPAPSRIVTGHPLTGIWIDKKT